MPATSTKKRQLSVELVWNREFDWSMYRRVEASLAEAKKQAIDVRDSGDGARVKKVRVIDSDTGKVLWQG